MSFPEAQRLRVRPVASRGSVLRRWRGLAAVPQPAPPAGGPPQAHRCPRPRSLPGARWVSAEHGGPRTVRVLSLLEGKAGSGPVQGAGPKRHRITSASGVVDESQVGGGDLRSWEWQQDPWPVTGSRPSCSWSPPPCWPPGLFSQARRRACWVGTPGLRGMSPQGASVTPWGPSEL